MICSREYIHNTIHGFPSPMIPLLELWARLLVIHFTEQASVRVSGMSQVFFETFLG